MGKGGTIIRLVDVALIILFGFIIISRLKMSEISLPEKAAGATSASDSHFLRARILRDVENARDRFTLIDESGNTELANSLQIADFESALLQEYNRLAGEAKVILLIEPDEDSIIQHTVDLLDLCKKHGITKELNIEGY